MSTGYVVAGEYISKISKETISYFPMLPFDKSESVIFCETPKH